MQAELLNREHTDLNVVVGLCVGHDSLFYKYSDAPVTTAVTKDRVLCHNPVAALYGADSYYKTRECEKKSVKAPSMVITGVEQLKSAVLDW